MPQNSIDESQVNIGSGNSLVPDAMKPLSERMLTKAYNAIWYYQGTESKYTEVWTNGCHFADSIFKCILIRENYYWSLSQESIS